MARQIGFGNDDEKERRDRRAPQTDGRALQPDPPRADRKTVLNVLIPNLVLYVMAGAGGYIAYTGLTDGKIMGFVFGTIFCVVTFTAATSRIIKRILGLDAPKTPGVRNRNWTLDDPGP